MAERRMFSKTIIESDLFLDMPMSARLLYYELGMRGDDDGFVDSPKKVTRMIGASDDDLKLLAAKGYIIPFASGIVVIVHWRTHNYIRNDRYKETQHLIEKHMLTVGKNGNYSLSNIVGIPNGNQSSTAGIPSGSITEGRLGEGNIEKEIPPLPPTGEEESGGLESAPKRKRGELTKSQEERFNRFWSVYPRRESKGNAKKAWAKIDPDETLTQAILAAVAMAIMHDNRFRERQFTPLPASWLNSESWLNEYGEPSRASPNREPESGIPYAN